MYQRVLQTSLALIGIAGVLFFSLQFKESHQHRERIRLFILSNLHDATFRSSLVRIESNFTRINAHELLWNGKMHDIIDTETSGGKTVYICFPDEKENITQALVEKHLCELFKSVNSHGSYKNNIAEFSWKICPDNPIRIRFSDSRLTSSAHLIAESLQEGVQKRGSPPPEV